MRAKDYGAEDFDRILAINLRARGGIINGDSLITCAPLRDVVPYAMSKAGMAMEWGPRAVRVNGIAPGFFPMPRCAKLWESEPLKKRDQANTPLGSLGKVEDRVGNTTFRASTASRYLSGQTLRVDDGVCASINWPVDRP